GEPDFAAQDGGGARRHAIVRGRGETAIGSGTDPREALAQGRRCRRRPGSGEPLRRGGRDGTRRLGGTGGRGAGSGGRGRPFPRPRACGGRQEGRDGRHSRRRWPRDDSYGALRRDSEHPPDQGHRHPLEEEGAVTAAALLALALWAEGDALVKTRPRGRITVEIGSQTFGPVVADPRGEAVVPVVVPPGVTQARQGKRMIPLGVPPTRTVHVAFGAAGPRADRAQKVAVYAIATTADGAPRRGAAIRLRSSRGSLTALREVAPGLYQSWLSLEAGAEGEVGVTAALYDAPAFVAKAALSLASGPADRISMTADRGRIRADQPVARLHVSARDAAGNPAADVLEFETNAGELRTTATAAGEWDLDLSLPASFGG